MKQTINWHKESLKNMKAYLEREQNMLRIHTVAVQKLENDVKMLEYQITEAEKEHKDGFDSEKYRRIKHG